VTPSAITVVWTTKGEHGTLLKQARSADRGRSFSHSAIIPGSDAAGNRGWQAIAADASGRVDVVWLDHRELAENAGMATAHHQHNGGSGGKPDGVAMAQKSKLFLASLDGAVAPRAITGGVCYCCKTAIVAGVNGQLLAAWRHVYPGNLRDIAFTMSKDRGQTFGPVVRVSEDKWMIEGCPDDGPAMAIDGRNRIHVVWPTLVTDANGTDQTIALFYAASSDGRTFSPRQRIPTEGMPHHPTIALGPDGTPVLAWDEAGSGSRRVVVGAAHAAATDRAPAFTRTVVSAGDAGVYPAIASANGATIVAWTRGSGAQSTIRVVRLE
jgi:hypothetical protein